VSLISILIVTRNSERRIEPCLDSVLASAAAEYELIVVDNASGDQTKPIIKNRYPRARVIENRENLGYAKALNQGIRAAAGDFILCLNDDAELADPGAVAIMYEALKADGNAGALQPKVLGADGRIDTAGIRLSFLRRYYDIDNGKASFSGPAQSSYIFGACNAAVMYRRSALESVRQGDEYFDEDFFCLVEDVDLSWRMQRKGWRTLYRPDAVCRHARGLSRRKDSYARSLNMRNRYLMLIKNESLWGFLRLPIVFLVYDVWRNLFMLIINPINFLKSLYSVAVLSPKMVAKRVK
jgi:GT2 family glycosyltransferase